MLFVVFTLGLFYPKLRLDVRGDGKRAMGLSSQLPVELAFNEAYQGWNIKERMKLGFLSDSPESRVQTDKIGSSARLSLTTRFTVVFRILLATSLYKAI